MTRMIAAALLLAGCSATAEEPEMEIREAGTGRTCEAAPAQGLVGRPATAELAAEAMRLTGAGALRWIPEESMVTMDFRPDRLNIELDGQNRVSAIRCG